MKEVTIGGGISPCLGPRIQFNPEIFDYLILSQELDKWTINHVQTRSTEEGNRSLSDCVIVDRRRIVQTLKNALRTKPKTGRRNYSVPPSLRRYLVGSRKSKFTGRII